MPGEPRGSGGEVQPLSNGDLPSDALTGSALRRPDRRLFNSLYQGAPVAVTGSRLPSSEGCTASVPGEADGTGSCGMY